MLRNARDLEGYIFQTQDGPVGNVHDFFFEDPGWKIRYVIVDTGTWLPGDKVLVSSDAIENADWRTHELRVELSRDDIHSAQRLEHQEDPQGASLWLGAAGAANDMAYWWPQGMPGGASIMVSRVLNETPSEETAESFGGGQQLAVAPPEHRLRSIREVRHYHIHASDGNIGHAVDLLLSDETWSFRYLIVDTRNWLPGRTVLLSPRWITDIDEADRKIHLRITKHQVEHSPRFDESRTVDRRYEKALFDHYGFPGYWI